jgi:hypothetical protein
VNDIPHIPLVTVQVRELDYRFHELIGLELRGQATGEEIAELNAMCAVKEALPELDPNSNGQWL